MLLLLVLVATIGIFSASQAGTVRGWTVRYVAPLYVVVPIFLGVGIEGLWSAARTLAIITAAALLIPNLLCYGLPRSQLRSQLTAELSDYMGLERALILYKVHSSTETTRGFMI
jgi:hypothetical protein